MLGFLNKYGSNVHSQNGEDGIIAECVRRMELSDLHCAEIGANDGLWMSNIRALLNRYESTGLFVEADYALYLKCKENWKDNPRVRCQCSRVDGKNINAFVDERCDVLSLDTDGGDYEIFKGLVDRPQIVIVEIDSSIPPTEFAFNSDGGAGYRPMVELADEKGYALLCHTGNLIFIRGQHVIDFPELGGNDPIEDWQLYFRTDWLKQEAA